MQEIQCATTRGTNDDYGYPGVQVGALRFRGTAGTRRRNYLLLSDDRAFSDQKISLVVRARLLKQREERSCSVDYLLAVKKTAMNYCKGTRTAVVSLVIIFLPHNGEEERSLRFEDNV